MITYLRIILCSYLSIIYACMSSLWGQWEIHMYNGSSIEHRHNLRFSFLSFERVLRCALHVSKPLEGRLLLEICNSNRNGACCLCTCTTVHKSLSQGKKWISRGWDQPQNCPPGLFWKDCANGYNKPSFWPAVSVRFWLTQIVFLKYYFEK